jgi:uncharacterized protein (TIGR02284 family)
MGTACPFKGFTGRAWPSRQAQQRMMAMQPTVPPMTPPATSLPHADVNHDSTALTTLYDRIVDSVQGFAKMVEKAEPSFRDTAERFRALHARHAGELARMLAESGIEVDGDGTVMGTINRAVVTFRAFFDEIDEDVMDQVRSGEDWVLKAFDEAIDEQGDTARSAALREMQSELTGLLAETRHLD